MSGGAGGVRGAGLNQSSSGYYGAGGVGIVANDSVALTLGSGAVVTGGLSGDGVTRASAITLGGAVNRLELRAGANVVGYVFASGMSALALGGTADGTFDVSTLGSAGQYRGFTGFSKDGASIWTLTGTSSFTGVGVVDAGTLAVDGDVSSFSTLTVNAGGVLGGSGTVGATTISGGTLAPGNSIGTLSVAGNLAFTAAATYAVEVSPATADRVTVTGTAVLGGATVQATFANGSYVARQYTILTATGGVSGTFGTLTNVNLPAAFKTGLSYDPNNAYLDLTLDFTPAPTSTPSAPTPVSPPASEAVPNRNLNPNQTSAANALTAYFNANGSIPLAYGTLTPQTLSEAAGEPAATTQQNSFDAMSQFTGAIMPTSMYGRGTPIASAPASYAAYSSSGGKAVALPRLAADPDAWRWSVWGSGFGGRQSHSGQASQGVAASSNSVYGLAAGADYRVSPSTVAGFALAGGATDFSTRGLGTGHSDLAQLGVFIRHHIGQAYAAAAAAYGWQGITQDRSVAGVDRLRSKFDVHSLSGRIESGYRFGAPSLGLTPFAAAQFVVSALPGYAERVMSGPGLFALSYAGRDAVDRRGEIGLRADTTFAVAGFAITLTGGLAWARNFETGRATATASFQALPGASFLVSGANRDRNGLRSSAGAELKWKNGLALAAAFEGEFTQRSRSYGGKAVLRYTW
ncbi:autotransporter domain-containing protein [Bosea sp. 124]|uniref:autotransporter outer membrane beta-barrel domain-containing protein n=1 Tax=Bosea sp. 124 TaxID=2135642 RepID=UPI0020BEC4F4|nr:autotransporter domain-containing protein [Bosea sp. 124]